MIVPEDGLDRLARLIAPSDPWTDRREEERRLLDEAGERPEDKISHAIGQANLSLLLAVWIVLGLAAFSHVVEVGAAEILGGILAWLISEKILTRAYRITYIRAIQGRSEADQHEARDETNDTDHGRGGRRPGEGGRKSDPTQLEGLGRTE